MLNNSAAGVEKTDGAAQENDHVNRQKKRTRGEESGPVAAKGNWVCHDLN